MPTEVAPLRSFKLRRGRVTPGQRDALDRLWSRYGVGTPGPDVDLDPQSGPFVAASVFGRTAPLVLEIGFGMGEATLAMAEADPACDVLAVDVHTPGAGALLRGVEERGLANVRVLLGDAVAVLRDLLGPGSLDEVRVYFPDPWPKARHHKRRLVSPAFVDLVAGRLAPGGRLHCATDWEPYAERILQVVDEHPLLANLHPGFAPRPPWRPVTRFERQGLARGHTVRDVLAVRLAS